MTKILTISKNPHVMHAMNSFLAQQGFIPEAASELKEVTDLCGQVFFKLVLVDLPSFSGQDQELSRSLQLLHSTTPVLFLCDIPVEGTFLKGMSLNRNDYIIKPFRVNEFRTKINQLLDLSPKERILRCGPLRIDLVKQLVTVKDKMVKLSQKEKAILIQLAQKAGDIVSQEKLIRSLEAEGKVCFETFNHHLQALRTQLKEVAGENLRISTLYGKGYRLEAAV